MNIPKLLAALSAAASEENARYTLSYVRLARTDQGIDACATNGHQLIVLTFKEGAEGLALPDDDQPVYVPPSALRILAEAKPKRRKALGMKCERGKGWVRVSTVGAESTVSVQFDDPSAVFPEYEDVFSKTPPDRTVLLDARYLADILAMMALLAEAQDALDTSTPGVPIKVHFRGSPEGRPVEFEAHDCKEGLRIRAALMPRTG